MKKIQRYQEVSKRSDKDPREEKFSDLVQFKAHKIEILSKLKLVL
jgi:hypothetical protein